MLWAAICSKGVLSFGENEWNDEQKDVLSKRTILGLLKIGKTFAFHKDNDPKHSSKLCRNYLSVKEKSGIILGLKLYKFIKFDFFKLM